ncbi:MAG: RNA polymerase sigma factor [Candidatus Acidiferrales bacterium]
MMSFAAILPEGMLALDSEVAQLRRGDLEALGAIFARYQNRLYRYLLRLVREPAEAEDLFQQTWLRVAERIRQYDARRSFEAWLFAVARNLAIDSLRRRRPESLTEPEADEDRAGLAAKLRSKEPAALDTLMAQERSGKLLAALGELHVMYRDVLTLRFEEEMKLEEIAEVLDVPLSTVKTRLRRGLDGLRRNFEGRYAAGEWS